jgi:hypothetical protein
MDRRSFILCGGVLLTSGCMDFMGSESGNEDDSSGTTTTSSGNLGPKQGPGPQSGSGPDASDDDVEAGPGAEGFGTPESGPDADGGGVGPGPGPIEEEDESTPGQFGPGGDAEGTTTGTAVPPFGPGTSNS